MKPSLRYRTACVLDVLASFGTAAAFAQTDPLGLRLGALRR